MRRAALPPASSPTLPRHSDRSVAEWRNPAPVIPIPLDFARGRLRVAEWRSRNLVESRTTTDMLKVKDRLKNNITPSCMGLFNVAVEEIGEKDVIKIIFASGTEKSYYIKKLGMSEICTTSM
ncbi:MAG: hypothetical protein LBK47_04035 [Prevotellaceae bacterium]|jgi:hypothetical protein|nr:hypothetical protein [Prevotellaceae bacterium]